MSVRDAYLADVEDVARVHLETFRETGGNPFQAAEAIAEHQRVTRDAIEEFVTPGRAILDAGCGIGTLLEPFMHYVCVGVDIVPEYLEIAGRRGYETRLADLEDLPFEDGRFGTVVCTDVLEHVLDLNAVMRELVRVLSPGGHLIVRVPFEEDLTEYLTCGWRYVHLRRFDWPTLVLLFDRIFGLEVIEGRPSVVGRSSEITVIGRKP